MSLAKPHRNTVAIDNLYFAFTAVFTYLIIFVFTRQPFDALYSVIVLLAITELIVHLFYIQEISYFASFLRIIISMSVVMIVHNVFLDMMGIEDIEQISYILTI